MSTYKQMVEKPCGCRVNVNDYGDYQSIAGFAKWCDQAKELISQLAAVGGRRRCVADIADEINAHVLFA
ncbi:hypothetical protein SAMN05216275_10542 [Streptosporangium canum]|uniref:Uncharacterized protein n=1 Tax=Streptosporangium canum TaxID=324952 RepID=A0A1I3L7J2_9ACTN|nr:hypothetical protein [Streptosporangium canum]SFI80772.1 hypothetical protein SAMN05216275_10542 [Streptosporangium canum]